MWTNGLLRTLLAIERGQVDGEDIASNADVYWVFRDGAVGGYTHAGGSGFEGFAHEFEDVRRAFHDAQDAWLWPYRVAVRDLERRSDQPGASRELFETEPELKGLLAGLKRDAELRATAEDQLSAVRSGRSSCEVLTDDDHALYVFAGGAAFNLQKPTPEPYAAAPPTKVCALRLHDVLEAFDRELP